MFTSLQHALTRAVLMTACVAVVTGTAAAQSHYEGAIGPGSSYEIDVPAAWNGDLVLYAHGIVQASQPVVPPTSQDGYAAIRTALLARGYAVAASSYSSNGWALADAVRRTHQLSGIFKSKVGAPARTLLVGHSMGALAIAKMAEVYPGQYDGALPMCGPLGGALTEVQYAGDARVTFDYYFPGVLPGGPFDVPEGIPYESNPPSPLFLQVYGALLSNPAKMQQWALAAKLPFASAAELGNSAFYVVGFVWRYTNDLIARVNGKLPYDNRDTVYQVNATADPAVNAALSAQLNAGVARFDAARPALNYYERNYQPDGGISFPVVTLHTLRDPAIPYDHENQYAALVAAAGRSDWLVQRAVNRWGHCAMTTGEVLDAFTALESWVQTGVRP
jgi:pimeloyl-ACP methyl ester carboxylesterase